MKTPTATTIIPALQESVTPAAGPVRLMYDPTLKRPLRLRDGQGVKLDAESHDRAASVLAGLGAVLQPLEIAYVGAKLRDPANAGSGRLDGERMACLPQLLIAYAASDAALEGLVLKLRASLRVVENDGPTRAIDAALDVEVDATAGADPATAAAVNAYSHWAAKTWANCVGSVLGHWAIANGLTELRLAAVFAGLTGKSEGVR